ncbi:MAG: aminotransferase class I/II-fold pyridoxal phosphate-dependent enzyme [Bacteroidia bacterium]
MPLEERLIQELEKRKQQNAYRTLRYNPALVDFSSNDYLGLARSEKLKALIQQELIKYPDLPLGSTGSRLLCGNYPLIEETEVQIAAFHKAEAAIIFNSGYDANVGLLSSVPKKGDTILYDSLCHASIRDGIRLSQAKSYSFSHNNIDDLTKKLRFAEGEVFVIAESVYSMDGDTAPLLELADFCLKNSLNLIIDEAHATGVFGKNGEGLVSELNIENKIFARIHTFGKALGIHGAAVVGSQPLRNYLINFARPFIYSTALPPQTILSIKCAYEMLPALHEERKQVFHLSQLIQESWQKINNAKFIKANGPVQALIVPGNENVKILSNELQMADLDVRPILSPTVPAGSERLRLCLHAFNTEDEVDLLNSMIKAFFSKYIYGKENA